MNRPIIKEIFLSHSTCPTLGWYMRNQPLEARPSEGALFRMEQGKEVGRLARSLFPGGRSIPFGSNEAAVSLTKAALANPSVQTVFEATFAAGCYIAKPDIILRASTGWRVIEVKMNLADTKNLDELIDDLAYSVTVMTQAGIAIAAAELMLVDGDYRKGQDTAHLFKRLDQTGAVIQRVAEFQSVWDQIERDTTEGRPTAKLIPGCKDCAYFETDCLGKGISQTVFCIPRIHKNRIAELSQSGIVNLSDLREDFPLTDIQKRVVDGCLSGVPYVDPSLPEFLSKIEWPAHYLDFESVMTALPLYDNRGPYEQITTQYSIHERQSPSDTPEHRDFLADPARDCEEDLAKQLIADLGEEGSILVYSSFEKQRVNAMAKRFPRLAKPLEAIVNRFVDLLKILRDGYYHPDFGRRFSIKVVLPVLAPELSYDGLEIGDGELAVARFAKMAMGLYSPEQQRQVKRDLLTYCEQDTVAMVKLHEALARLAHPNQ